MKKKLKLRTLFALYLSTFLLLLLSGCRSVEYVPVVRTQTDTMKVVDRFRDSIYVHDSIMVTQTGDTVTIERWHTRWREILKTDTFIQSSRDTITQVVKVPAQLTSWQAFCIDYGKVMLGVSVILALVIALLLFKPHPRPLSKGRGE